MRNGEQGSGTEPCIALWYYEPRPPVVTRGTSYQERRVYFNEIEKIR